MFKGTNFPGLRENYNFVDPFFVFFPSNSLYTPTANL